MDNIIANMKLTVSSDPSSEASSSSSPEFAEPLSESDAFLEASDPDISEYSSPSSGRALTRRFKISETAMVAIEDGV